MREPFKYLLSNWDRLLPSVAAVLSLLALILYGWSRDRDIARLAGRIDYINEELNRLERLEEDSDTIRNWVIAVYERGSARGWDLPDPPEPSTRGKDQTLGQDQPMKDRSKGDDDDGN